MWQKPYRKDDVEGGAPLLYPVMQESPELRWGFIRKVYMIIAVQLLATIAVFAVVVSVPSITNFFKTSSAGMPLGIFIIFIPIIVLFPLYYYSQKHPVNFLLLGIFTVAMSFSVGMTCAYTDGKLVLESAILTAAVVVSITLYTFWAVKRGHDFNFLGPFLCGTLTVLVIFGFIQIFFPFGKLGQMIYGGIGSIIFCGYIVYDTDNLIKRFTYDEYIWASVSLYLDIINLFLSLLRILEAANN